MRDGQQASGTGAMPPWARALGWAGLLPFAGLAALVWMAPLAWQALAAQALLAYGATILSFLGGLPWGIALAECRRVESVRTPASMSSGTAWLFGLGVVPQLWGWGALLLGGRAGLVAVALGLLGMLLIDRRLIAEARVPGWYGALRLPLTLVAATTLLLGSLR